MSFRLPFISSPARSALTKRLTAFGLAIAALAGAGCDGAREGSAGSTGGTEGPCGPADVLLDDGRCQPPGLPLDMKCPPGETPLDDGRCQAAGVPPDQCGDGFEPDGDGGCKPILPEE